MELSRQREATFQRIIAGAPATLTAAQLRVLLRAIVNLDPYTFLDNLAEELSEESEREGNDHRSSEEVLLERLAGTADEKLTGFAVRLALSGHRGIPREGESDLLSQAEQAFRAPKRQKKNAGKKKEPTPIRAAKAKKTTAPRKRLAA